MNFARVLQLISDFFEGVNQPFAVIGALGLATIGVSRATFDVDIVAPGEIQGALVDFLESEGFRTEHRSTGYSNHVHSNEELGRLDVVYIRGATAEQVFGGTEIKEGPGGVSLPVPRPEHLAAMKIFAIKNNPMRVLRDLDDVQCILNVPGVNRDEILSYFKKQGLEDLIERLN